MPLGPGESTSLAGNPGERADGLELQARRAPTEPCFSPTRSEREPWQLCQVASRA